MQSNPMVQRLLQQHPEMAASMRDPDLMRQAMRAAMDPAYKAELTRAQDQAMRHVSALPGGDAAMQRMYTDVTAPAEEDMATGGPTAASQPSGAPANPWARRSSAVPPAAGAFCAVGCGCFSRLVSLCLLCHVPPHASTCIVFAGTTADNAAANPFAAMMGGMGGQGGMPGMGGMGGMGGGGMGGAMAMMQQPGMMEAVAGMMSNPAMMSMMENSNPALKSMLDSNPGMREMMANPDFIRQAMNPATMQAMQGMMGGQGGMPGMGGTGGMGGQGGMPDLAAMMAGMGGGVPGATTGAPAPAPSTGTTGTTDATGNTGTQPAFDMASMMQAMQGMQGGAPSGAAPPANTNFEELYSSQLAEMEGMGFTDKDANIRALKATGGNVQFAINRLFGD